MRIHKVLLDTLRWISQGSELNVCGMVDPIRHLRKVLAITNWFVVALLFSLVITGCDKSGDSGGFGFADDSSASDETSGLVEIIDYTPKSNPVVVTSGQTTTFAVVVSAASGDGVKYKFQLDGAVLQDTEKSIFELDGADVAGGDHSLIVTAYNSASEASHAFNIRKNTAPQITSTTPGAGGNAVSCGSGSLSFEAEATDADGDALTFTWKLNSAIVSSVFTITSGAGESEAVFAPPCVVAGSNVVTVEVSDGRDTTTYSWAVTVHNPIVVSIDGYTPTSSPIIIPSTGSQLFSVSAVGKAPLAYSWLLNGTPISGANSSFYTLTAGSLTVGEHTLTALVEDSDSSDSVDFEIIRNAPPELSNETPTAATTKLNYQSTLQFSVDADDQNGDTLTYAWTMDGGPSGFLADSTTATGSQAIFSPDNSIIGAHTIRVTVSDGTESTTATWTVEVNYFNDACNNLAAGQICTVIGRAGIGSGSNIAVSPGLINIRPNDIEDDGQGNIFVSDGMSHVVWFFNRSNSPVTRLGVSIPAKTAQVLVGNGAAGKTPDGSVGTNFKLNRPEGLAWDPVNGRLFISDYDNYRVVMVNSAGVGQRVACNETGNNNDANHPENGSPLDHACDRPLGLAYDSSAKLLYVANINDDNIKVFDLSDANPANWTGRIFVGVKNGTGATTAGNDDGTLGSAGVAKVGAPWAMDLDSAGNLYWIDTDSCRLRVANTSGSPLSFFGGGRTVAVGTVKRLTQADNTTNQCGHAIGGYAAVKFNVPRGLEVREDGGGNVLGWFVSSTNSDRVLYLNNTNTAVNYGGASIAGYSADVIFGNGSAAYNGDGLVGDQTAVDVPSGIFYDSTSNLLIVADYNNMRVRTLNLAIASGLGSTIMGERSKYGHLSDTAMPGNQVLLNFPKGLVADQVRKEILVSDTNNGRIRKLDLVTGIVTTFIGKGLGNASINPVGPLDAFQRYPRDLHVTGLGNLIFVNREDATGTNRSCMVRMYNRTNSSVTLNDISIDSLMIANLAGDYALGCNASVSGDDATSTPLFRPEGVTSDGTNLYISNEVDHCIVKVDGSGVLTEFIGSCGNLGHTDGVIGAPAVRLRNPGDLELDPQYAAQGNFFVADQTLSNVAYVKYVNQTATPIEISGVTVPANSIGTVYTTTGRVKGIAAFDNQICYTQGEGLNGPSNVLCHNRTDSLGNVTLRVGSANSSPIEAGGPLSETEQEGISASSATLYDPHALAFDGDGNLYILERSNHQVRKVRRWF